jgi:hypothetical protein
MGFNSQKEMFALREEKGQFISNNRWESIVLGCQVQRWIDEKVRICGDSLLITVVPIHLLGICSKTPSRYLKPWTILNTIYTVFFFLHK